jgi:hypothetical protein
MSVEDFLTKVFTGPRVRLAGLIMSVAGVLLLAGHVQAVGYAIGLLIAFLATFNPNAFKWLSNFADPQFWPAFVGLGVAIICAAYVGGLFGLLACIGPLTAYDGMYFDQNY